MTRTLIAGARLVTMNPQREVTDADLLVEDGRIARIGHDLAASIPDLAPGERVDARGLVCLPGLVQTHVHLCQSLFRNLADDLPLMDWLRQRIWPFEGALTRSAMRASAELGLAELVRGGTTTILDMGSVHHTDAVAEAVEQAGVRAFIGKAMMDDGDQVPPTLRETAADSLAESLELARAYDGAAGGRVRYAFCPRFAFSCSERLLRQVGELLAEGKHLLHTHANETVWEATESRKRWGNSNVGYLHQVGLTGARSVFAHGVHLEDAERGLLARTGTGVAHCPSSNLKLASGIADVPRLLAAGVKVGLGADGAPCNNSLDAFVEMRLAALLQKPIHGPEAMPARQVLAMATIEGARVLGLEREIGSLEPGKAADLVLADLGGPHHGVDGPVAEALGGDVYARVVYSAHAADVRLVMVAGEVLFENGRLARYDLQELVRRGREALAEVARRL